MRAGGWGGVVLVVVVGCVCVCVCVWVGGGGRDAWMALIQVLPLAGAVC